MLNNLINFLIDMSGDNLLSLVILNDFHKIKIYI